MYRNNYLRIRHWTFLEYIGFHLKVPICAPWAIIPLLRCRPVPVRTRVQPFGSGKNETRLEKIYLDKGFSTFEEMLSTIGLRPLLVPIYDGLSRDTILIIQNLHEDSE
jgi:hypothetical protein